MLLKQFFEKWKINRNLISTKMKITSTKLNRKLNDKLAGKIVSKDKEALEPIVREMYEDLGNLIKNEFSNK